MKKPVLNQEIIDYFDRISPEIKESFPKNFLEHKRLSPTYEDLTSHFLSKLSVKDVKELLSNYNEESVLRVGVESDYPDGEYSYLKVELEVPARYETDNELIDRVNKKISNIYKKERKANKSKP